MSYYNHNDHEHNNNNNIRVLANGTGIDTSQLLSMIGSLGSFDFTPFIGTNTHFSLTTIGPPQQSYQGPTRNSKDDLYLETNHLKGKKNIWDFLTKSTLNKIYLRYNKGKGEKVYYRTAVTFFKRKIKEEEWVKSITDVDINQLDDIKCQIRAAIKKINTEIYGVSKLKTTLDIIENIGKTRYFPQIYNLSVAQVSDIMRVIGLTNEEIKIMTFGEAVDMISNYKDKKDILNKLKRKKARYQQIADIPQDVKSIIYSGINSNREILKTYFQAKPIELYMRLPHKQMKKKLGIVHDEYLMDSPFMDSLSEYINVAKNLYEGNHVYDNDYTGLTDKRLQKVTNVRKIKTRRDYIHQLRTTLILDKDFFIPYDKSKGDNYKDMSITGDEFSDENEICIAFGKIENPMIISTPFRCYLISELCFTFTHHHGYYLPESNTSKFNDQQISSLHTICDYLRKVYANDKNKLQQIKDLTQIISLIRTDPNNKIIKAMINNKELNEKIKEYFIIFFDWAMYLRRWKGPPNKYPLMAKDTKYNNNLEWEVRVRDEVAKMNTLMEEYPDLKQIDELGLITKTDDNKDFIVHGGIRSLGYYRDLVLSDSECIRVASTLLSVSAFFYLKTICNYIIREDGKELNILNIERIM